MTPDHFRQPPTAGAAPSPASEERSGAGPTGALWSLRVEDANGALTWRALELGSYDVGRDVDCGIRLDSREVSRRHVSLWRDGAGQWWIKPKAEHASTLVNGRPIADQRRLSPWDEVQLGGFHLRLVPRDGSGFARDRRRDVVMPFVEDELIGRTPPPRVRIYDGDFGGHDVRLDKGVVSFSAAPDSTVPIEGLGPGVCVEFRAVQGGFEVVDRSEQPSMTVNGHELRRFELSSDELVGIGDVERQRKDGRDALRVRFLPGGRKPGQETTPAPSKGSSVGASVVPPSDVTVRTFGTPGEASVGDTDPGTAPPPTDVVPKGVRDTAVDLIAPHGLPSEDRPEATEPATWSEGASLVPDGEPTSLTVGGDSQRYADGLVDDGLTTTREMAPVPTFDGGPRGPATEPLPATSSRPAGTPPVDAATAGPKSDRRTGDADGASDAEARGGTSALARSGLVLASLVVVAVLLWLWWRPSPADGIAEPGPRPTASDVATNVAETVPAASTAGSPPGVSSPATSSPRRAPSSPAGTPTTPGRTSPPVRPPTSARPRPTAEAPAGRDVDQGDGASEALRRRLDAKAAAGRASREELNQLLELCTDLGNTACAQRARGLLARQEGP